jgi:hypothetical protein
MSIPAAVAELNKEIATLDKAITEAEKKKARLASVRDCLLKEESEIGTVPAERRKPGRKPGAVRKSAVVKKAAVTKKTAIAKKTAAPKKRVLSDEARKKIGEAQKKRWAAQRKSATAS